MAFELLSEPIRRFIRDKRWEGLRPIQAAAISRILTTDDNYILASRTASGKTEAAFLPILSQVNFNEKGVQVLYISPLIALINDQFIRIEELCKYLEVKITKWHGEAKKSAKEQVIKDPNGIILITPESLEAMLVNKPYLISHLFSNLKFVVIDEIHAFCGTDRGTQLKSILSRINHLTSKSCRLIGLSATIGDYNEVKSFVGLPEETKVLLDKTAKMTHVEFRYFPSSKDISDEMYDSLYSETCLNKVLLFPNSRGKAEEISVRLKRIAEKKRGHLNYFSHHSSVDRELREYVEHFAKNNQRENFCISCTSTLELGIDIGSVDQVIQVDSTFSIASLIQRMGRSGRREGAESVLLLYATRPWSLLQSLACWQLYTKGFIEPSLSPEKPYDLYLHQILSIVKGTNGIKQEELYHQLAKNAAFLKIGSSEFDRIMSHLLQNDLLESIRGEVIIGLEGEKVVNGREFYTVFRTEENFKVIHANTTIGEIPLSIQIQENENILLAAKIWKIHSIDFETKRIEVIRANDGKRPIFGGEGGIVHDKIRQQMLEIIYTTALDDEIDEAGLLALKELRSQFAIYSLKDTSVERPVQINLETLEVFLFKGTKVNRTIHFLLKEAGLKGILDEEMSSIEIEVTFLEFIKAWNQLPVYAALFDQIIMELVSKNESPYTSKWGYLLPVEFQSQLVKHHYFDLPGAMEFLTSVKWIPNTLHDGN